MRVAVCSMVLLFPAVVAAQPFGACVTQRYAGISDPFYRPSSSGDYGPASEALLQNVTAITVDREGNLLVLESGRIRKITTDGVIVGITGYGDGVPARGIHALIAGIGYAQGMATTPDGSVLVADSFHSQVVRISPDSVARVAARIDHPQTIAADPHGGILIASGASIWRLPSEGELERIADLPGVIADLATGSDGYIYAITGYPPELIRVSPEGAVTTFDVPVPDSGVNRSIRGIAIDELGNVYVSQTYAARILKMNRMGSWSAVANTPPGGFVWSLAFGRGQLFLGGDTRVYALSADGVLRTIAGAARYVGGADGGRADQTLLGSTSGVAFDPQGNGYIAGLDRIRRVSPEGIIRTIAGGGDSDADGPALQVRLDAPTSPLWHEGELYFSDRGNRRIRKLAADGYIRTVAGSGLYDLPREGLHALDSPLGYPTAIAFDNSGILYICDADSHSIRKVGRDGIMTTVAGTGRPGYSGDGGPALYAQLAHPVGLTVDDAGNLYVGDWGNNRVRKISTSGIITTFAGSAGPGFSGDGGPAVSARLRSPGAVLATPDGRILIVDVNNLSVRTVSREGTIDSVACLHLDYLESSGLVLDPQGRVTITSANGAVYRAVPPGPDSESAPYLDPARVRHVGQYDVIGAIAPGAFVEFGLASTVTGVYPGPVTGRYPTELDGARLLVSGIPAPLVALRSDAVIALVPVAVAGRPTAEIQLEYRGRLSNVIVMPVIDAYPNISRGASYLPLVGSSDYEARPGATVTLYATGAGIMDPPGIDGQVIAFEVSRPALPVSVRVGERQAELIGCQAAPGTTGVVRIDVRVPEGELELDGGGHVGVSITFGEWFTGTYSLYMR